MSLKKILGKMTAVALGLIIAGAACEGTMVNAAEEKEAYVIVTESEDTCGILLEEKTVEESKTDYLLEEDIVTLEMTKQEAEKLEKEKDITLVEKDIEITASGRKSFKTEKTKTRKAEKTDNENELEWNLKMIGVTDAPTKKTSSAEKVKIAVLDSGVEISEDVNVVERINLVAEEDYIPEYLEDVTGHGTSVAGLISDIAPNAEIYSVRILDVTNKTTLSRVMEAIFWCIDNDMDIINMSFGTEIETEAMRLAVEKAEEAGILMFASAGNGGTLADVEYPAAFEEVVAVGAVDTAAEKTEESATGEEVELVAPGEQIKVDGYFGGEMIASGTSLSTPQAAGAAAVLLGKDTTKSSDFIRGLMSESAKNLGDEEYYGNGLVDLEYALEQYDTYEKEYRECDNEIQLPENKNVAHTFEEIDYIEGRWGNSKHKEVPNTWVNQNLGSISLTELQAIKLYSIMSDVSVYEDWFKKDADKNSFFALHGSNNYVATLKFLYELASEFSRTSSITTYSAATAVIDAKTQTVLSANTLKALKRAVKKACSIKKEELLKRVVEEGDIAHATLPKNKEFACRMLGMAIHLAGDIYAHQTMIPTAPTYNESKTLPSAVASGVFYRAHFPDNATWKVFKTAVGKKLRFGGIKFYIKTNTAGERIVNYEDNANFYPRRFTIGNKDIVDMLLMMYQDTPKKTITYEFADLMFWHNTYCTELRLRNLKDYLNAIYPYRELGTIRKAWSFQEGA